jgi:hypothetical protein
MHGVTTRRCGDRAKALEWLATVLRLRDPDLIFLKTDPLLDPLRKEPRFQAVERQLKSPPRALPAPYFKRADCGTVGAAQILKKPES